ncbi:LacI family transcriptional regulator [Pullulanibacillus camelliae]|uniref:LacI family transcriptional regulator n=1 Tax=Pullulanibacillus camelliae TaxID=1707096 RepID=A0A8J3DZC3_9BACL|nr:LacI family DNA-binding transcriptional regulator [Pullulanibacillus camelliae]GGE51573.1 LacI family transcriptional regulator [Pullulanibacillus camelliae]
MKSSIEDVAKKAGVSVVTVSRVLNQSKSVRPRNREKVLKAIKELNYSPSAAAQTLALGKTRVIGLTISNLNDSFFEGVVKAISRNLERHGYFMALSVIPARTSSLNSNGGFLFQSDRVDGVILLTPVNEAVDSEVLKAKGIPFILLDHQNEYVNAPSIVVNNFKGGYEATQHLIQLGHRNIAHISGPDIYLSSKERRRGYLAAIRDAGVQGGQLQKSHFSIRGGFEATRKWLKDGKMPTAIFAADDFIALGAIHALHDRGWRVPEDISVVGFDDQSFAAEIHPRLTTVKQPEEEIGEKAVLHLLSLINHTIAEPESIRECLNPHLIIRESTAPPTRS